MGMLVGFGAIVTIVIVLILGVVPGSLVGAQHTLLPAMVSFGDQWTKSFGDPKTSLPKREEALAPSKPERAVVREYPEQRPDGSVWQVKQWSQPPLYSEQLVQGAPPRTAPVVPPAARVSQPAAPPQLAIGCSESQIGAGQVRFVKAGCTILGDVEVSAQQSGGFIRLYDDDPTTGLVVRLNRDGFVKAPWGASITGRPASQVASEMQASGCGSNCRLVTEKTW